MLQAGINLAIDLIIAAGTSLTVCICVLHIQTGLSDRRSGPAACLICAGLGSPPVRQEASLPTFKRATESAPQWAPAEHMDRSASSMFPFLASTEVGLIGKVTAKVIRPYTAGTG